MSLLIKNWSEADWKELLKWAKIGANNAMIGEFTEVEEVPPHGRLIDADAYEKLLRGLGNRDYRREAGTLQDAIKFLHPHYAPTIIPAEEGE